MEGIDLVYAWCDSADAVWNAKRLVAAKACGLRDDYAASNGECRYAANDELRFSLRSAEANVPWIRKVFLVIDADASLPAWLNTNCPKLRVVRHPEFIPASRLPCFSSPTIEHHIAFIDDLSERFLYANDDTMFARPLAPSFFFAKDGLPIVRLSGRLGDNPRSDNAYHATVRRAAELVRASHPDLGVDARDALGMLPHHCVDAYLKSDVAACFAKYEGAITAAMDGPFRSPRDIQRVIYAYEAIATARGHFRIARKGVWAGRMLFWKRLLGVSYADSLQFVREKWRLGPCAIRKWKPGLFCFNDTAGITGADREWLRTKYLEMFPVPCSFEKEGESRKEICR